MPRRWGGVGAVMSQVASIRGVGRRQAGVGTRQRHRPPVSRALMTPVYGRVAVQDVPSPRVAAIEGRLAIRFCGGVLLRPIERGLAHLVTHGRHY